MIMTFEHHLKLVLNLAITLAVVLKLCTFLGLTMSQIKFDIKLQKEVLIN